MPSPLISILKRGGIAVIPTDTIYGIVARAFDRKAVRRLYRLRRTTAKKPFIILISSVKDLATFGVTTNTAASRFLQRVWPGRVSVILPCKGKEFAYLHLDTQTLAFRMPRPRWLRVLLKKTGPLVAPSANPEGETPAETITRARRYFGDHIDAYVSAGRLIRNPSTLVSLLRTGAPRVLRLGSVRI